MRQMISLTLLLTLFASASCSSDKGSDNKESQVNNPSAPLTGSEQAPAEKPVAETPEAPVVTAPVQGEKGPLALDFAAKVQGEDLKCYDKSPEMLAAGQIFTDVRLFISNLSLINDAGEEVKLSLDSAENSANLQFTDADANTIALLNYLDPSCASSDATKTLKNVISGILPYGHYQALKFQVGLPYVAMDARLTKIPAALAPTDMAWMWEHYPAEFQIETSKGGAKSLLNALLSDNPVKPSITLALDFTHAKDAAAPKVQLELSKLFLTTGEAFIQGLEKDCTNNTKAMTEASPNCAQAYKALGLNVLNPHEAYTQSVFSIVP